MHLACRDEPGCIVHNGQCAIHPWIHIDGHALFRFATESFALAIRQALARSGRATDAARRIIPHQANARILKAAARRSGVDFDRFYLNVDHVGNTFSASIPLAIIEVEKDSNRGIRLPSVRSVPV
jgi:3-oxoacyl-[acyl-carrier-protein] synthase III